MYAVIRFLDEEKTRIVRTRKIKKFEIKTFNTKKAYKVLYDKDNEYYDAQVIAVNDSEAALQELSKKRIPLFNKNLLESASELSEYESSSELVDKKRGKSLNLKKIEKKNFGSKIVVTNRDKDIFHEYDNLGTKENENSEGNTKNEEEMDKLKEKIEIMKSQYCDLQLQNKELLKLNMNLQKLVIDKFDSLKERFSTPTNNLGLHIGDIKDGQVHLGRGVFIDQHIYNDVWFKSTTGAQFVKNMAVAIFGTKDLIESSVTGQPSNKFKMALPKKPLDGTRLAAIEDVYDLFLKKKDPKKDAIKEKKNIKAYIRSKISDLRKTVRSTQQEAEEKSEEEYKSEPEEKSEAEENSEADEKSEAEGDGEKGEEENED